MEVIGRKMVKSRAKPDVLRQGACGFVEGIVVAEPDGISQKQSLPRPLPLIILTYLSNYPINLLLRPLKKHEHISYPQRQLTQTSPLVEPTPTNPQPPLPTPHHPMPPLQKPLATPPTQTPHLYE